MKRTDLVGMVLALACVMHCLAMPLVLAYLPVFGMGWLTDPKVHYALIAAGLTLGGLSFLPGYRSRRRAWIPVLAVLGLGIMAYAAVYQEGSCCHDRLPKASGEVMWSRLVSFEGFQKGMEIGEASVGMNAASYAGSELPECCRNRHCAVETQAAESTISATRTSLDITQFMPRSWTPIGAILLLIAHLLNLKFRDYRGCAADCCASREQTDLDATTSAPSIEMAR